MEQVNQKTIEKLNSFRRLNYENWNGYGCAPWYVGEKSDEYIYQVSSLLEQIPVRLEVFPLGGNIVQIEFEDDTWYIEFELCEDHTANVYEQVFSLDEEREYTCYWWEIPNIIKDGGKIAPRG